LLIIALAGCKPCKGCVLDPPDTADTEDTGDTDDTDDTGDTGDTDTALEPPCDVPEEEPNNSLDDPNELPMEREGCGAFDYTNDFDAWTFDYDKTGWVGIHIDSRSLGSSAVVTLVLSSEGGEAAIYGQVPFSEDVHLVYPSLPDTYTALLVEGNNNGGSDNYFYEIIATAEKEPVSWNLEEVEPNDIRDDAQDLAGGDRLLAWPEDASDDDWYRLRIPAGRQAVTLDIDAYDFGSAGNYKLAVYDENLSAIGTFYLDEQASGPDPWADLNSEGDEDWYVSVIEEGGRGGRAYWYLLKVGMEGE